MEEDKEPFIKWKKLLVGCNKYRKKCLKSPLTSLCTKALFVFVNFAFLVSELLAFMMSVVARCIHGCWCCDG